MDQELPLPALCGEVCVGREEEQHVRVMLCLASRGAARADNVGNPFLSSLAEKPNRFGSDTALQRVVFLTPALQ